LFMQQIPTSSSSLSSGINPYMLLLLLADTIWLIAVLMKCLN
jgi:hypothetical protein